jgi:hypothetical protein
VLKVEALKELLGEELYQQLVSKLGDKKLAVVSDGQWFPKDKFDAVNSENKDLKAQIADRDKQLATLKDAAKGNEDLQKQIQQLQDDNKKAVDEWQGKLDALKFEHVLESALSKAKAKNPKAVKALLDASKIKLDGESLLGLDDQLKALQKSDAYLFDVQAGNGSGGANPPGGGAGTKNPWDKATWNLTEQGKILRENPTLAAQLRAAAGIK